MKFTVDDLQKLSKLAKIKIKKEEESKLVGQMENILGYFEMLSELDLKDVEPMKHISEYKNYLREDIVGESLSNKVALKNAPEDKYGFFCVPKVLKGE